MTDEKCSAFSGYALIIGSLKDELTRLENLAFWGAAVPQACALRSNKLSSEGQLIVSTSDGAIGLTFNSALTVLFGAKVRKNRVGK
jgi:hypothetical protein